MTMIDKHKHSSVARKPKTKINKRLSYRAKLAPESNSKGNHKSQNSEKNISGDWIYGIHPVMAALANSQRIIYRIVISDNASEELIKDVKLAYKKTTYVQNIEVISREKISSLLPLGAVHQSIAILVSPLKTLTIKDVIKETENNSDAIIIALDQATDPRNIGAVLRSAAAFGAIAVIIQQRNAPSQSGALNKAASGAAEWIPMVRVVNLARSITSLKQVGFWATGLDAKASRTLAEADLSGRILLVIGSEGKGLRRLTRETCDELLKITVNKKSDSLNLSNATTVALYELNRQRN